MGSQTVATRFSAHLTEHICCMLLIIALWITRAGKSRGFSFLSYWTEVACELESEIFSIHITGILADFLRIEMHFKESSLDFLLFYSFINFLPCYIVLFQVYSPGDNVRFHCLVVFNNSHVTKFLKKRILFVYCLYFIWIFLNENLILI